MQNDLVFIAMSFRPEFNSVYFEVFEKICRKKNLVPYRANEHQVLSQPISREMKRNMKECKFFIADISFNSPNVFYEIGFLQAYNKKGIFVSQLKENPPYYIYDYLVIQYGPGINNLKKLLAALDKEIDILLSS